MAWPSVCIACLLTTFAVAGLAQADAPPAFAATRPFRGLATAAAILGVLTAVIAGAGGCQRPQENLGSDPNSIPIALLDRLDVADGAIVVLSSPAFEACQTAEQYLQVNHRSWVIRYPCDALRSRGCWYTPSSSWRVPTVLRRDGDHYQVVGREFSAKQWSEIR